MRTFFLLIGLVPSMLLAQVKFADDFEDGKLSGWTLMNPNAIRVVDSGNEEHGKVLELRADDAVLALIEGSEEWGAVRLEGDVYFADEGHNYLAFVYNFNQQGRRTDFGSIYLKGNGSYLRVNPWRDLNVSRLLYEEYLTPLQGESAIDIGQWHSFKMEVKGTVCHVYVDDMDTPKLVFSLYEHASGKVGFNSRVAGSPAWVDNVRVTSIQKLGYNGPDIPKIAYQPDELVTDWETIGPFPGAVESVERSGYVSQVNVQGREHEWRRFETDARGAVISGRVTEFRGGRPVAYFRTTLDAAQEKTSILQFSSVDELAVWVNGEFQGYVYRNGYVDDGDWNAWYDFWKNPDHAGRRIPIHLNEGKNVIVVRTYNGQFASGGFFARWE